MAKDDELFSGNDDLGTELNLDDMNFDDEFDFEKEIEKAKNEPVTPGNIMKKTISNAVTIDQNRIKKFIRKGVPSKVVDAYDQYEGFYDTLSSSLNKNTTRLKKELQEMGDTVDKILPQSGILRDVFSKIYNPKEEKEKYERSKEEIELANVKNDLMESFGDLAQMQEMQNKLNNVLNDKRTESTNKILKEMGANVGFLKDYNFQFTSKFQNKLLEVQIHSLYVLSDIRQVMREANEQNQEKLASIVQNTALPDILKARNNFDTITKEFFSKGREQLVDRLYNNDKVKKIREALDKKVDDLFEGIFDAVDMGKTIGGFLETQKEMNDMMGKNLNDTVSEQIVGKADETLAKQVGKYIGKIPGLNKVFSFMVQAADDPYTMLNQLADKTGNTTFLHTTAGKLLRGAADVLNVNDSTRSADLSKVNLDDFTQFDFRTKNSINRVIPVYLRKIHAELIADRMGYRNPNQPDGYIDAKAFEQHYDERGDKFTSLSDFKSKVGKFIRGEGAKFRAGANKTLTQKLFKRVGLENDISARDRTKISNYLSSMIKGNSLTATQLLQKITAQDIMDSAGVDEETANLFHSKMTSHLNDFNNVPEVTSIFNSIRKNTPAFHKLIEEMVKGNNADILIDAGLLDIDEDGNLSVNDDALDTLSFQDFGLNLSPESKQRNRDIVNGLVEYNKNEYTGSIAENLEKTLKYGRVVAKAGKRKVTRSDTYKYIAEKADQINKNFIAPKLEKLKGKAGEVGNKIMSHPAVLAASLAGQAAYNKAIDSVVKQLGHELDAAEKSELIKALKEKYGVVHKQYEKFVGSDTAKAIKETYNELEAGYKKAAEQVESGMSLDEIKIANAKEAKTSLLGKVGGFLGIGKGKAKNAIGGKLDELKNSETAKTLVDLLEVTHAPDLYNKSVEKAGEYKNTAQQYLDKIKNAGSAKDAIQMIGNDMKIDTTDARREFINQRNIGDGVAAIQEAAKSGDEAFLNETLKFLKQQGLDKYEAIKNAANRAREHFRNRDKTAKQAQKAVLEIRDPIDAISAVWKLGAAGVNLLPMGSTIKLAWRIFKGINKVMWNTEKWIWGGLGKRGWNASIGRIGDIFGRDWRFKRNANALNYLHPASILGGALGGGLGGLWRNKGNIAGGLWDAGKGLYHGGALGLDFLFNGLNGGLSSDRLSKMTKSFGSAGNKILGTAGDTALNIFDQYDSIARTRHFNNAFSKPGKKDPWYMRMFRKKNAFDDIVTDEPAVKDRLDLLAHGYSEDMRLRVLDKEDKQDPNEPKTAVGFLDRIFKRGSRTIDSVSNKAKDAYYDSALGQTFASKAYKEKFLRNRDTAKNQFLKQNKAKLLQEYKKAALNGDDETKRMISDSLLQYASNDIEKSSLLTLMHKYDGQTNYQKVAQASVSKNFHKGTGKMNLPGPEEKKQVKSRLKKRQRFFKQYEEAIQMGDKEKWRLSRLEELMYESAKTDAEREEITKFLYAQEDKMNKAKELAEKIDIDAQTITPQISKPEAKVMHVDGKDGNRQLAKTMNQALLDSGQYYSDGKNIHKVATYGDVSMDKYDVEKSKLIADAKAKEEKKKEELKEMKTEALQRMAALSTLYALEPEKQQMVIEEVRSSGNNMEAVAEMPFFGKFKSRVKEWALNKLKKGGSKFLEWMKKIGGTLFGAFFGPLMAILKKLGLGGVADILGNSFLGKMAGAGLGGTLMNMFGQGEYYDENGKHRKKQPKNPKKPSKWQRFKNMAGKAGKWGLIGALGYSMLSPLMGEDGSSSSEDSSSGFGIGDALAMASLGGAGLSAAKGIHGYFRNKDRDNDVDSKEKKDTSKKNTKNDKVEQAKQHTKNADAKSKAKATTGNTKDQKGLINKVKSTIKNFVSKVKDRVIKKIGPKAAVRLLSELAGKIALRLNVFTGWSMLAIDVVSIGKYLLGGMGLLSAISMCYLGFDVFSDDESGAPVDSDGNPIEMDPEDKKALEQEAAEKESKKVEKDVKPNTTAQTSQTQEQPKPSNPDVVRTSTSSNNTTTQGSPFDMSIMRSNLNVAEKQLVVLMSNNQELKKINSTLERLANYAPTSQQSVVTKEDKNKKLNKMSHTYDATSNVINMNRAYNI